MFAFLFQIIAINECSWQLANLCRLLDIHWGVVQLLCWHTSWGSRRSLPLLLVWRLLQVYMLCLFFSF